MDVRLKELLNRTCRYRTCYEMLGCQQELRRVYGIEAIAEHDEQEVYHAVKRISDDRGLVESLVETLNRYRLPPIHLEDVVEDLTI